MEARPRDLILIDRDDGVSMGMQRGALLPPFNFTHSLLLLADTYLYIRFFFGEIGGLEGYITTPCNYHTDSIMKNHIYTVIVVCT